MIHTPLSHLTTGELVGQVLNADEPSWMELELIQRIEWLQDALDDLKGHDSPDVEGVPV